MISKRVFYFKVIRMQYKTVYRKAPWSDIGDMSYIILVILFWTQYCWTVQDNPYIGQWFRFLHWKQ